ncbi:MAG: type II secretion system GspH family protein [Verrucomicrobia bacterium]|nr:type II secretion system GspH family protein [Verrucomicrobiota bacterium]
MLRCVGFSLIELLVVIAIVAILASLLVPVLSQARMKAKRVRCASNMRQIGLGMRMYSDENRGSLPGAGHGLEATSESWIHLLKPYGITNPQLRQCPADKLAMARTQNGGSSYILNGYVAIDQISPFGEMIESFRYLDRIRRPVQTMILFEISDRIEPESFTDHAHSRAWTGNWQNVISEIQPDRHHSGKTASQHNSGLANYLFADMHVEALDAQNLYRRILQEDNFARPPR